MKLNKVWSGLLLLAFMATACHRKDSDDALLKKEDILNASYGTDSLNTMDVYLPEGRSDTTRVIIFLHGGSWSGGDKKELDSIPQYFRDKGFATVNVNYRLTHTSDSYKLRDLKEDVANAVSYIAGNAKKWHVSSDKFGMLGVSAGAHLALLYTYEGNPDNRVKTVVSIAGPVNLTDTRKIGFLQATVTEWLLGSSLQSNYSAYVQASPITFVTSLSKPTLVVHGLNDDVVPIEQVKDMVSKLNQVGVKNKAIYQPTGHENLINPTNKDLIIAETELWFRENIK